MFASCIHLSSYTWQHAATRTYDICESSDHIVVSHTVPQTTVPQYHSTVQSQLQHSTCVCCYMLLHVVIMDMMTSSWHMSWCHVATCNMHDASWCIMNAYVVCIPCMLCMHECVLYCTVVTVVAVVAVVLCYCGTVLLWYCMTVTSYAEDHVTVDVHWSNQLGIAGSP